ncbi:MAG TPA: asparaginase [Thermoanaerobaculia bacterium]|jgi:L-asparaginase
MTKESPASHGKVLVLYTGGTIGSRPRDKEDPGSPQFVVPWKELEAGTPELAKLKERGFQVDAVSSEKPLDSCNIGPKEWTQFAKIISDRYDDYEGFVILHGTDTMVYTASALSFMLRGLRKPVILTGAQRSALVDVRNDASQNFLTALLLANPRYSGIPTVPEVSIYFGGKLLRGNRTIKLDTTGYEAYVAPNVPPLGEIGDQMSLHKERINWPKDNERFRVRLRLEERILPLFIYPGITPEVVEAQIQATQPKAVIVQAFGSGNIPNLDPKFVEVFRKARQEQNILIAVVSQCTRGPVELGIYETSAELLEAGFVCANDITLEAAQCKLMALLGDPDISLEVAEEDFQRSLAGELSLSTYVTKYSGKPDSLSAKAPAASPGKVRFPAQQLAGIWDASNLAQALLRFRRARVKIGDGNDLNEHAEYEIYLNVDPDEKLTPVHPNFAGRFKKYSMEQESLVLFDITEAIRPFARPGERISFTLQCNDLRAEFTWQSVELAVLIQEI